MISEGYGSDRLMGSDLPNASRPYTVILKLCFKVVACFRGVLSL